MSEIVCGACGVRVSGGSFCSNCGAALSNAAGRSLLKHCEAMAVDSEVKLQKRKEWLAAKSNEGGMSSIEKRRRHVAQAEKQSLKWRSWADFVRTALGGAEAGSGADVRDDPQEPLLTVEEVAERLQTTPRSVYRLVKSGRLVGVRIGPKTLRFLHSSVTEFLRAVAEGR